MFLIICALKISLINLYNFNQLNKKALIIGVDRKEFTDLSQYLLSRKYTVSVIRKKRNKILLKKKNLNKICSRIIDITKFNDIFNFIKKEKFHSIYYNPKKLINKSIDKYQENISKYRFKNFLFPIGKDLPWKLNLFSCQNYNYAIGEKIFITPDTSWKLTNSLGWNLKLWKNYEFPNISNFQTKEYYCIFIKKQIQFSFLVLDLNVHEPVKKVRKNKI